MQSMTSGLILSLCDHSGVWSRPYLEAGYKVVRVDLKAGQDVRLMPHVGQRVHGILAAPPCSHFARSGAPHWQAKGESALLDGLAVVDACLRAVAIYRPDWWALENPIGRLKDFLGPPCWRFDPCDFGDPWTKRTWLWGHFTPPVPILCPSAVRVHPIEIDRTTRRSGKVARSVTPAGFSRAFFEANP
jgi:hypothetical protein